MTNCKICKLEPAMKGMEGLCFDCTSLHGAILRLYSRNPTQAEEYLKHVLDHEGFCGSASPHDFELDWGEEATYPSAGPEDFEEELS